MLIIKEKLRILFGAFLITSVFGLSSCATYYQKNRQFQEAFAQGDLDRADKLLAKNEKAAEGRNRLLYFMQKGVVLNMQGKYEESNSYLEKAYVYIDDYKVHYGIEALSLISNPSIKPYRGEDHEIVLIHYYKALNYLQLANPADALVECRRLNIKLNQLNDKYEGKKNRYKNDAFAHVLMGIAYEMDNDVNNAFIAYRNAYNTYKESYASNFGVSAPEQLKQDLLRTAYLNGFIEELQQYEKEFNTTYSYQPKKGGELIFFWHNGLGPVKSEWSINFTVVRGDGGSVTFVNEELGVNFPFYVENNEDRNARLGDLKVVRVAFPKYLVRRPVFHSADLFIDSVAHPLEKVENIEGIALSVLQDRMLREIATSIARLAVKQASELSARKENDDLGAVLSVINAVTEKADTRNWQTLPNTISYSRIPLKIGSNKVHLKTYSSTNVAENVSSEEFEFTLEEAATIFHVFSSMDSYAPREQ